MANPFKGEVAIEIDGAPYCLIFTVNSLCELEEALDASVSEIGEMLGSGMRVRELRVAFWSALLARHGVSPDAAGDLMSAFGIKQSAEAIAQALVLAFPEEDAKAPARPPKAKLRAGTG
jgi:hypothetical protein